MPGVAPNFSNCEVHHLFIYESDGTRCVNLSPSVSDLNKQFKAATKSNLDTYVWRFLKSQVPFWDPSKAAQCEVLLENKTRYSVVAVEGDRASKVVIFLTEGGGTGQGKTGRRRQSASSASKGRVLPRSKSSPIVVDEDELSGRGGSHSQGNFPSQSSSDALPLLHRATATFLDSKFLLLGEPPSQQPAGSTNTSKRLASPPPEDLPPLPCGVRDFEDAFALFDRDGTGWLTLEKFQQGLDMLNVRLKRQAVTQLFKTMSNNRDKMDYRHFLRFFTTDGSREPGPMALRAGLARAKSVSHFSAMNTPEVQSRIDPTATEKRIRGLERVLAILELHAGRYAGDKSGEFDLTRCFIGVNRKALSRYRRYVFRRMLGGSNHRRSSVSSMNSIKNKHKGRSNSQSMGGRRSSLSAKISGKGDEIFVTSKKDRTLSPGLAKGADSSEKHYKKENVVLRKEVNQLKDKVRGLEIEARNKRRNIRPAHMRRTNTVDISGGQGSAIERTLQAQVRKLEGEKQSIDDKLRTVQEKAQLRQEQLRRDMRRIKAQRDKLKEELVAAKEAKPEPPPVDPEKLRAEITAEVTKKVTAQVENELLRACKKAVDSDATKVAVFEAELDSKINPCKTVVAVVKELRRILNNWVARSESMSKDLSKTKKKLDAALKKQAQSQEPGLHSAPAPKSSPNRRGSPPTSPSPFLHQMGSGGVFAGGDLLLNPGHSDGKKNGKSQSQTSLPSIVKIEPGTTQQGQQPAKGGKGERGRNGSVSLGIPGSLERSDSARFIFGETYITELESENQRLRNLHMQLRMDMEITDVQKQRFGAQVKELRRTCQIYRNSAGDVKEHWIQLEDRLDTCKRQIRDLIDDIQDAKRKGESADKVAEFRVEYAKNLQELQQQLQTQDQTIKLHLTKIDDVMDENLKLQDKILHLNEEKPDTKLSGRVVTLMRKNSDLETAMGKLRMAKQAPDRASHLKIADLETRLRQHERALANAGLRPILNDRPSRPSRPSTGDASVERVKRSSRGSVEVVDGKTEDDEGGGRRKKANSSSSGKMGHRKRGSGTSPAVPRVVQPNQRPGGGGGGLSSSATHGGVRAPAAKKKPSSGRGGRVTALQLARFVDVDELDGKNSGGNREKNL